MWVFCVFLGGGGGVFGGSSVFFIGGIVIEGCSSYLLCFFTFVRLFWEHDCWLFLFSSFEGFLCKPFELFLVQAN